MAKCAPNLNDAPIGGLSIDTPQTRPIDPELEIERKSFFGRLGMVLSALEELKANGTAEEKQRLAAKELAQCVQDRAGFSVTYEIKEIGHSSIGYRPSQVFLTSYSEDGIPERTAMGFVGEIACGGSEEGPCYGTIMKVGEEAFLVNRTAMYGYGDSESRAIIGYSQPWSNDRVSSNGEEFTLTTRDSLEEAIDDGDGLCDVLVGALEHPTEWDLSRSARTRAFTETTDLLWGELSPYDMTTYDYFAGERDEIKMVDPQGYYFRFADQGSNTVNITLDPEEPPMELMLNTKEGASSLELFAHGFSYDAPFPCEMSLSLSEVQSDPESLHEFVECHAINTGNSY